MTRLYAIILKQEGAMLGYLGPEAGSRRRPDAPYEAPPVVASHRMARKHSAYGEACCHALAVGVRFPGLELDVVGLLDPEVARSGRVAGDPAAPAPKGSPR